MSLQVIYTREETVASATLVDIIIEVFRLTSWGTVGSVRRRELLRSRTAGCCISGRIHCYRRRVEMEEERSIPEQTDRRNSIGSRVKKLYASGAACNFNAKLEGPYGTEQARLDSASGLLYPGEAGLDSSNETFDSLYHVADIEML